MGLVFGLLFFLIPLVFYPKSSEVFEFNKIILLYSGTIGITSIWAIKMIVQKKIIFRRTILDIPLVIFLMSQAISTLVSIDPHTSIFGYYSRFNGGLLSTAAYCLLYWAFVSNISLREARKVICLALFSGLIVSIYGILEHTGRSPSCLLINRQFNAACWVQDVQERVFATLGQPNWLAAYLVALSPLAWAQTLKTKRWLFYSLAFLFFATLLFTKSRSGLLGFVAADLVFWALIFWKHKKKYLKNFIILNSLFLILIVIFGIPWTTIQSNKAQEPALESGGTESGQIRKIVWRGAIDIWKAHPLFGTGVETFAYSYYQFRPQEHNLVSEWDFLYNKAHNEYLNYLATTGIIGLVAYLVLIVFSILQITNYQLPISNQFPNLEIKKFIKLLKTGKWKLENIALLAGYSSILVTNFFGFSVVPISLLFFLYPALAVAQDQKSKPKSPNLRNLSASQKAQIAIVLGILLYALSLTLNYWRADFAYSEGKAASKNLEVQTAVIKLNEAIERSPAEALYHNELAETYGLIAAAFFEEKEATFSARYATAAIEESNTAFRLSPRNINIRKSRANLFSELSIIDETLLLESIKALEDIAKIAPTDAKVFYTLGSFYMRAGQNQKALESLQKALQLKPDYQKARNLLEKLEKNPDLR